MSRLKDVSGEVFAKGFKATQDAINLSFGEGLSKETGEAVNFNLILKTGIVPKPKTLDLSD